MITINEKKQEYFDKTVEHLAQQGRRSVEENRCVYRHPTGLKCSFGVFIPDKLYNPELEGKNINILHEHGLVEFTGEVDLNFAYQLQLIHDLKFNKTPELVRLRLNEFAKINGLDDSKVALITKWEI